jgi:hypothetical protein
MVRVTSSVVDLRIRLKGKAEQERRVSGNKGILLEKRAGNIEMSAVSTLCHWPIGSP